MTGKGLSGIIASVIAIVLACTAGGVLLFGGGAAARCAATVPSGTSAVPTPSGGWPAVNGFTTEQVTNAATITTVGADKRVPVRGWIIAVATAIQESSLRNLPNGPDDSIGLFHQRPSQGWGSPAQLRDPVYAAGKFYDTLLTIAGWQQMPLTEAAQAVQNSAEPDKYAQHETDAVALVAAVTHMPLQDLLSCGVTTGEWTQPINAPAGSGFRTADRPTHDGVDLSAPHGTPIRAASAGTVERVRCNAVRESDGSNYGCDRDGHPTNVKGCGWYIDIEHSGGVVTRYCHMLSRPPVKAGQTVVTGQEIGKVGSSGNSSGPHLHFEIHLNGGHDPTSAIDPVPFMAQQGVPLR